MIGPAFALLLWLAAVSQESPASLLFPVTVVGDEHVAWEQPADSDAQIATFRYIAYIDGDAAVDVSGESCRRSSPAVAFTCSAPLLPLSLGLHTIEIATSIKGSAIVSPRSNRLYLLVVGGPPRSDRSSRIGVASTVTTNDNVPLTLTPIVTGLVDPVDLAFMPDGGLIVAERSGLLRIVRGGRLVSPAGWPVFERRSEQERLLSVAVDADFERSHFVSAIYTILSAQNELTFCLVRFREVADTFTDRIVIAGEVRASPDGASAALRFGPDGKLFVAVDDGGSASSAGDWSSYNGKVLRFNPDGTTPDDQQSHVPLYSFPFRSPRGLAWHLPSNTLWVVSQEVDGPRLIAVASNSIQRRGAIQATLALPAGTVPSGVAVYPETGTAEAFRGNVLVASDEGRSLLRLRTDPLMPTRIVATEQLLIDRIGGIRAPVVGPDGAIYLAAEDTIWRLSP